MLRIFLCIIAASIAFAAEDAWPKVKDLKTGTEIRVFKKGSMQPVVAQLAEATDDNLVIIVKNEQSAIPRDQVDRLDYRPEQKGGRLRSETKSTPHDPKPNVSNPRGGSGPNSSYSSGVTIVDKPAFETLYRRPPPAPKQAR
jgi:hypothetical protein